MLTRGRAVAGRSAEAGRACEGGNNPIFSDAESEPDEPEEAAQSGSSMSPRDKWRRTIALLKTQLPRKADPPAHAFAKRVWSGLERVKDAVVGCVLVAAYPLLWAVFMTIAALMWHGACAWDKDDLGGHYVPGVTCVTDKWTKDSEYPWVRRLPPISVSVQDLVMSIIGFNYLWEHWEHQAEVTAFATQNLDWGMKRMNFSLNMLDHRGGLIMRTIEEVMTFSLLQSASTDGKHLRQAVISASETKHDDSYDPFLRLDEEDTAKRLSQHIGVHHLSSLSSAGHFVQSLGGAILPDNAYVFGITYESLDTASAERKIRVLLIKESLLASPTFDAYADCPGDQSFRAKAKVSGTLANYTQCRFADLQRLRALWDQRKREVAEREAGRASQPSPPFYLIGSCHISVPAST